MILNFMNLDLINNIFQIDIRYFIAIHVVLSIILISIFRHLRQKYKLNIVPPNLVVPSHNIDDTTRTEMLNKELEPFGYVYDLKQDAFYSAMNCWQREFGYCRLYDEACAPIGIILDCEPIRFEYDGKKWLIEFWKGQYGMCTGAEIGIFATTQSDLNIPNFFQGTFYDKISDQERLKMAFTLRKDNNILFYREDIHWWLTGFKLGEFTKSTASLTMDIRITFPTQGMRNAFLAALFKAGYSIEKVKIKHYTVSFIFDTPHTPQPLTRNKLTESVSFKSEEFLCKTYNNITEDYNTTLDKLEFLKLFSPKVYQYLFNIGKPKELYKDYHTIQDYQNKLINPKGKGE